jgi:hypothetical protein
MAVEISNGTTVPHATDHADFLAKLVVFATANGWTELENSADKVVLQGEGSGSDEIFVGLQKYANVGADCFGLRVNGYIGYLDGYDFSNQPGAIQITDAGGWGALATPLWDTTIPYWFVVSGRRIIAVAKIGTTYQMLYLGFYLPFATPNQYPYPLAVGGSFVGNTLNPEPRYSGTGTQYSMPFTALHGGGGVGTMFMRLPGGSWYTTANQVDRGMFPYNQPDISAMRQALDDSAVLTAIEIQHFTSSTNKNRLGEIDGLYHVSGFGLSAEDIITVGADDYLVVPNVYRSDAASYVAVKLA